MVGTATFFRRWAMFRKEHRPFRFTHRLNSPDSARGIEINRSGIEKNCANRYNARAEMMNYPHLANHQEREIKFMKRFFFSLLLATSLTAFVIQFVSVRHASAARAGATDGVPYSSDWRITGPTGGDVRELVVDPSDPDRFYFGTLDGQLYTSTDGARTWRLLVNFNRPRLFVDHIIVDPRNSKVL